MPSELPEACASPESPAPPAAPAEGSSPPPSPWNLRELFYLLLFAPFALLVSNLVAAAGYVTFRHLTGRHGPVGAAGQNPFLLVANQSLFYAFLFGYIYLLVVAKYRSPFWRTIQWRNPTLRQALFRFLEGVLLAVLVQFAPQLLPDKENFPLEQLLRSPQGAYVVGAFAVFVAPFMEELLFRGVLFAIFERRAGLRFAVVSTAILFAALHVPEYWGAWHHVMMILLVGVVFSLARGLTGSLAPSVILHLAYNATLMAAFLLEQHRTAALDGLFLP